MKAILTILLVIGIGFIFATDRHVGPGQAYGSIQTAYSASSNGDRIIIHHRVGHYECYIAVGMDIDFIGESSNPNDVLIEARDEGNGSIVFEFFNGADCTVSNLTFQNSDTGVQINSGANVTIDNCIFKCMDFNGVSCGYGSTVEISDCIVKQTSFEGIVSGISSSYNCMITNTLVYNNGTGISMHSGTISNCTIVDNGQGVTSDITYHPSVTNSIVYGNNSSQLSNYITSVTYSCIEGGHAGTGNISVGPQFTDASTDDYSLQWNSSGISPCIDAGNPFQYDPDGTHSDMGAIPAPAHSYKYYSFYARPPSGIALKEIIHWVCFPVIDNLYTADNVASEFFDDIDYWFVSIQHDNTSATVDGYHNWTYPWEALADDTDPIDGFKICTNSYQSMTKMGFLADPETSISLTTGDNPNWVGYFLEESQYPLDALEGYLSQLTQIKHHDWTLTKVGSAWFGGAGYTINYGDMVELTCNTNFSFQWNNDFSRQTPVYKEQTSYYVFDEDADYTPVYLDLSGYADNMPVEVGMYADGQLIGATVVDGEQTQINAYVDDFENLDNAEVSFELYYGNRGPLDSCSMYKVNSVQTNGFVSTTKLFETESHYYRVTLGQADGESFVPDLPETASIDNYPNPFNPETTIAFSLPQDGDVCIKVYNARGQLVKTLVDSNMNAGNHEVVWDGHDEMNRQVGSGIYFCQMKTAGKTINRKLLMMK